jgi:DNA-3-methyladenine glycosylase II
MLEAPEVPPAMRAALAKLCALDPDLAEIEPRCGALPWRRRPPGFPGLLQAITAQQISNQAAHAIWTRLRALPGALTPQGLLALDDDAFRSAGLSRPKVAHARALAEACASGRLDLDAVAGLTDTEAVAAITTVRGIGPWTAEVYLLFALERADVFPAGDVALQGAAAAVKRLPARPDAPGLRAIAAGWQPWRALAARLLWHHWRHATGRPAMDDIAAP